MSPRLRAGALGLALSQSVATGSPAQTLAGTAFTYQGRLLDGGSPAEGTYDVQFTLFGASAGGTQVGPVLVQEDVAISGGLFTVSLDFGPDPSRWWGRGRSCSRRPMPCSAPRRPGRD